MAALAAAMMIAGGGWLLSHEEKPVVRQPREDQREFNVAHEKAFLAEQLRRNPGHTPILLRLAQMERSEGDLRGARQHLEQALAIDGRQVDIHLELGLVCWELGDFAAAEEHNRAVLRVDANQPDALYNLGAFSANRGNSRQAREFWLTAVRNGRNADAVDKSRNALERLKALQ